MESSAAIPYAVFDTLFQQITMKSAGLRKGLFRINLWSVPCFEVLRVEVHYEVANNRGVQIDSSVVGCVGGSVSIDCHVGIRYPVLAPPIPLKLFLVVDKFPKSFTFFCAEFEYFPWKVELKFHANTLPVVRAPLMVVLAET